MGTDKLNEDNWFEKGLELSRQEKFEEVVQGFEKVLDINL